MRRIRGSAGVMLAIDRGASSAEWTGTRNVGRSRLVQASGPQAAPAPRRTGDAYRIQYPMRSSPICRSGWRGPGFPARSRDPAGTTAPTSPT